MPDVSCGLVHARGTCFRSQKKAGAPYQVQVTLDRSSGVVKATTCQCPAGSGGACSHVLALLRLLVLLQQHGYKEPPPVLSCTELPQRWRRPRHEGIKPTSVQSVDWRRVHEGGREVPKSVNLCGAQSKDDERVLQSCKNFGERLMALGKTSFAAVLLSDPGAMVSTKFGLAPSGSPATYHQGHQPSGFTTWLGNLSPGKSLSLPLPRLDFFEDSVQHEFQGDFSSREKAILDDISVSIQEARDLEKNTRQQSQSETWVRARRHRLTASAFGKVLMRQSWTQKGLHHLLDPKDLSRVRPIQYGRRNEAAATHRYTNVLRKLGHDVTVEHCGLFVDPASPWLGATPDRLVFDPEEGTFGVLEVKCPYSLTGSDPKTVPDNENFYMQFTNGSEPRLLRDHEYYQQVVGQMALTGCQWGDFAVFSEKWIAIERIRFENSEWEAMKARLDFFFFNDMLRYFCET
ncbi:uncharacterized protein LOC144146942 isoform X1 [Haemaphysalis longicornis]